MTINKETDLSSLEYKELMDFKKENEIKSASNSRDDVEKAIKDFLEIEDSNEELLRVEDVVALLEEENKKLKEEIEQKNKAIKALEEKLESIKDPESFEKKKRNALEIEAEKLIDSTPAADVDRFAKAFDLKTKEEAIKFLVEKKPASIKAGKIW